MLMCAEYQRAPQKCGVTNASINALHKNVEVYSLVLAQISNVMRIGKHFDKDHKCVTHSFFDVTVGCPLFGLL